MIQQIINKEFDLIVKKIKKVKNNYQVTFLNQAGLEFLYKFTEDQLVENRITLDKKLSFDDLNRIIKNSNLIEWYSKCLKHILIKPRTIKEIYNYLDKSNLDVDSKEQIVNKLIEYKYLDDVVYIKYFLDECTEKCLGKQYVIHGLERVGISSLLINEYIDSYNESDLVERLTTKYQKIEYTLISLPILKQKLILTKKMALKGILTTTIQEVLNNIEFSEDIDKTFEKDLNRIKKETIDNDKIIQKLIRLGYTYDYIKRHIDV